MIPDMDQMPECDDIPIDPKAVLIGWGALILCAFTVAGCAYGFLKHFGVLP